jgi:hypothetical protein
VFQHVCTCGHLVALVVASMRVCYGSCCLRMLRFLSCCCVIPVAAALGSLGRQIGSSTQVDSSDSSNTFVHPSISFCSVTTCSAWPILSLCALPGCSNIFSLSFLSSEQAPEADLQILAWLSHREAAGKRHCGRREQTGLHPGWQKQRPSAWCAIVTLFGLLYGHHTACTSCMLPQTAELLHISGSSSSGSSCGCGRISQRQHAFLCLFRTNTSQ